MIAKLDELTAAERRALVREAVKRDRTGDTGAATIAHVAPDAPAWEPKLSKEEFVRQMQDLGPMSEESYAAYQQAIAWSSEIDHSDWQ